MLIMSFFWGALAVANNMMAGDTCKLRTQPVDQLSTNSQRAGPPITFCSCFVFLITCHRAKSHAFMVLCKETNNASKYFRKNTSSHIDEFQKTKNPVQRTSQSIDRISLCLWNTSIAAGHLNRKEASNATLFFKTFYALFEHWQVFQRMTCMSSISWLLTWSLSSSLWHFRMLIAVHRWVFGRASRSKDCVTSLSFVHEDSLLVLILEERRWPQGLVPGSWKMVVCSIVFWWLLSKPVGAEDRYLISHFVTAL